MKDYPKTVLEAAEMIYATRALRKEIETASDKILKKMDIDRDTATRACDRRLRFLYRRRIILMDRQTRVTRTAPTMA